MAESGANKAEAYRLYLDEGWDVERIAEYLELSFQRVKSWTEEFHKVEREIWATRWNSPTMW